MRPILIAVCYAVLAAVPLNAAPGEESAARIDAWLADVETLDGRFEQQLLDESGELLGASKGTMTLKRPGRFLWHYTAPAELLVVSDGQRIYSYDVELENVTVMQQTDALSSSPAQLLAGAGSVSDGFEVRSAWSSENYDWFELVPREGQQDFRAVRLGFDETELVAMELHDQLGQVTRIAFVGLRRNVPVADEKFAFVVPEGVDVITGPETAR